LGLSLGLNISLSPKPCPHLSQIPSPLCIGLSPSLILNLKQSLNPSPRNSKILSKILRLTLNMILNLCESLRKRRHARKRII
jgi:hypothetical protein